MTPVFPHCTSADLPAATKTSFPTKQRRDGCEKGREGLVESPGEGAEEEGRIGRRQGQEEEVVQGQDEGQAEQPGSLRQGHLRQAHEGGALLQADHPLDRLGEDEGPGLLGEEGAPRVADKGAHPSGCEAPVSAHLHQGDEGGGRRRSRGGERWQEVITPHSSSFFSLFDFPANSGNKCERQKHFFIRFALVFYSIFRFNMPCTWE